MRSFSLDGNLVNRSPNLTTRVHQPACALANDTDGRALPALTRKMAPLSHCAGGPAAASCWAGCTLSERLKACDEFMEWVKPSRAAVQAWKAAPAENCES